MVRLSIDVSKIDKTALYQGAKGKYLDVTLLETPDSKYGNDYMAVQDIGKERREAGEKGAILGNAKTFEKRDPQTAAGEEDQSQPADEEWPF